MSSSREQAVAEFRKVFKENFTIELLNGNNYYQWKISMQSLFNLWKLKEFMSKPLDIKTADTVDSELNDGAKLLILSKVDKEFHSTILGKSTAQEMMATLNEEFSWRIQPTPDQER